MGVMGVYGYLWVFMGFYECLWVSGCFLGCGSWVCMVYIGFLPYLLIQLYNIQNKIFLFEVGGYDNLRTNYSIWMVVRLICS